MTCVEIVPQFLTRISPDEVPRSRSAALIFAPRSVPGKLFAMRVLCLPLVCAPLNDEAMAPPLNKSTAANIRKTLRILSPPGLFPISVHQVLVSFRPALVAAHLRRASGISGLTLEQAIHAQIPLTADGG